MIVLIIITSWFKSAFAWNIYGLKLDQATMKRMDGDVHDSCSSPFNDYFRPGESTNGLSASLENKNYLCLLMTIK